MNKFLLLSALVASSITAKAQTTVVDTVSQGAGYANQVWYSLEKDEIGKRPRNNWDIAFQAFGGTTASVLINNYAGTSSTQTTVWRYTKGDAAVFGTALDTTGLSTWPKMYNSEKSWDAGAFGEMNGLDLGWGNYDMSTHIITGDSVYILKTIGSNFKQLFIEKLTSGTYTFKYADLNGSNVTTQTIAKNAFPGKNFGYFSIDSNKIQDREPDTAGAWDLFFCQYMASDYASTMQGVTGVLHNRGVKVAQQKFADSITAANNDTHAGLTYTSDINVIGWDWKPLNNSTFQYEIKDSVAYFIQTRNKDIWKVIFTGFGGSANGNYIFNKKKVYTEPVGMNNVAMPNNTTLALYPNPASSQTGVNILYSHEVAVKEAKLIVADMSGRILVNVAADTNTELNQYHLDTHNMPAGTYIIRIVTDAGVRVQKLSIN
ncbi:MAG: T9SS type A sorting domain-containing protein [Sphingobacteriales bacterium]|nr:MAG: T9SS type A sorting domain-containing protein [Sphingobacteriales bacterium]